MKTICVFVTTLLLLSAGCSTYTGIKDTSYGYSMMFAAPMPSPDDFKADRDNFIAKREAERKEDSALAHSPQTAFYCWSVAGILIGVGGGLYGAISDNKDSNRKVAETTSILTGAITTILTLFHFEARAKEYEANMKYLDQKIKEFGTTWSDISLPSDSTEFARYRSDKDEIVRGLPYK